MGKDIRKILYESSHFFVPKKIKNALDKHIYGSYEDTFYLNYWSVIHFLSGVLSGYIYIYLDYPKKKYFINMIIIHTLWEIWQFIIGSSSLKISGKNNIFDVLVDTILFMLGSLIPYYYYKKDDELNINKLD